MRRSAARRRTTRRTVTTRSVRKENAKVQTELNQIHNFCFKLSHLGMFESLSKLKKNSPRLKLEIVYMISCDTIFDIVISAVPKNLADQLYTPLLQVF